MAQIQPYPGQQKQPQLSRQLAKTATAVTLGVSLLFLSGLTLSATVVGIALATPLLVIFSPVLVPAAITLFLIAAGFVTAAGLGSTAGFVFYWMYSYVAGKHPVGSQLLDRAWEMVTHAARDVKEKGEELTMNAKGN